LLGRSVRLIVRRQPKQLGDQLAFDDLDGGRLHTIITNVAAERLSAAGVEAHHRLRGGIPEDTIRALKNDFGMIHAPVQPFLGNWLYWQAAALAHNIGLWLRTLALPRATPGARQTTAPGVLQRRCPAGASRPAPASALRRRLTSRRGLLRRAATHPGAIGFRLTAHNVCLTPALSH
jgi:hypothetical protein